SKQVLKMDGRMHERWADLFGGEHIFVSPYDTTLFERESIERRFLAMLNIDSAEYAKFQFLDKQINGSYSRSALALKRLLNLVLDKQKAKLNSEIDRCLQWYSDHHPERKVGLSELIPPEVFK